MSPHNATRRSAAHACAAALAIAVTSLTPTEDTLACFGFTPQPPEPRCIKTYTFAFEFPQTVLAETTDPGDPVSIKFNAYHFIGLSEANAMSPVCPPPGPAFPITQTITFDCDTGPNPSPITVTTSAPAGSSSQTCEFITIPPGPPRCCTVTITSTVTFPDGMQLSQTQKQKLCLVEPLPSDPDRARLDLHRIDADTGPLRVHPGDPANATYRITNNDPDHSWTGTISANMRNVAGEPTDLSGGTRFENIQIVSDPASIDGDIGDNFPIAFPDNLDNPPCVPLPPDPGAFPIPTIARDLTIPPGESAEVTILARPWPMCADGSCGQSLVTADGNFSDGTAALACASAVVAVDNTAPPQFECPGAGVAGCFLPPGGPLASFAFPIPDAPSAAYDFFLQPDFIPSTPPLQINGNPIPADTFFLPGPADLGKWASRATLRAQLPPATFAVDSFFDIAYEINTNAGPGAVNQDASFVQYDQIPSGPQGLEQIAPGFMGALALPTNDATLPDVAVALTHQLTARAETANGNSLEGRIIDAGTQITEANTLRVRLTVVFPDASPDDPLALLNVANDFRSFFAPTTPAEPPCPGDTDNNNTIDLNDLLTVLSNFGNAVPGGPAQGDVFPVDAPDGVVDLNDLLLVLSNFGNTCT